MTTDPVITYMWFYMCVYKDLSLICICVCMWILKGRTWNRGYCLSSSSILAQSGPEGGQLELSGKAERIGQVLEINWKRIYSFSLPPSFSPLILFSFVLTYLFNNFLKHIYPSLCCFFLPLLCVLACFAPPLSVVIFLGAVPILRETADNVY